VKIQRKGHVSTTIVDYRYRARNEHLADFPVVSEDYFAAEDIDISEGSSGHPFPRCPSVICTVRDSKRSSTS
jgi:hypothetical protein